MGSYEDIYYEVTEEMNRLNLKKEFDAELKKLREDDKYRYTEIRDRWAEARTRVITEYQKNKK